jgi:hypothetical protein
VSLNGLAGESRFVAPPDQRGLNWPNESKPSFLNVGYPLPLGFGTINRWAYPDGTNPTPPRLQMNHPFQLLILRMNFNF